MSNTKKLQEKWPKVVAEIVRIEGNEKCDFGHKVGERFEFSKFSTPKVCTYAYSALRPAIDVLLHGGWFPWAKKMKQFIGDARTPVRVK